MAKFREELLELSVRLGRDSKEWTHVDVDVRAHIVKLRIFLSLQSGVAPNQLSNRSPAISSASVIASY